MPLQAIGDPSVSTIIAIADQRFLPSTLNSYDPAPKARRQRESVLSSLPGSSTPGVGSKPGEPGGYLPTVFCEILIVSRFTLKC